MLFRTFDPYNDDYVNEKMCFICYEITTDDEIQTITLNMQEDYIKFCECNGFVHNSCLKKWYDKSNKCPICRRDVYKIITIPMIIINKSKYFYCIFFINLKNNINKITRTICLCLFIYYAFEFYIFLSFKKQNIVC